MADAFQNGLLRHAGSWWKKIPRQYHTPVILSSLAILIVTPYAWRRLTYKPKYPPPLAKYDRPLDNFSDCSSTLTLSNGRKIGYAQYGNLRGKAVIVLHGILGSRLEIELFDDDAKDLNVRVIGIERPGMGLSSPDPRPLKSRKTIDHARDVEALAEHLQLNEYAVVGISGGGPYALGCARALPTSPSKPKLKAVSVVTGLGLPDMSQPWPALLVFLNRRLNLRWLLQRIFVGSPVWDLNLSDDERREAMRKGFDLNKAHPADVETTRNPRYPFFVRVFLRSSREAISQGFNGFLDDAAILAKDPGFRVEDIPATLPVQLWYGTDDTNIAPAAGSETAQRLRSSGNTKVELHMIPGETHGSTQVKYRKQILQDVLRAMDS